MNLEKTEMLICSGAINSAGVVFAEILMKLRGGGEQGSGGQSDSAGGGCWGCCFAFFTRIWNSVLPPQAVADYF